MQHHNISLSIIIPCYNEEKRLETSFENIRNFYNNFDLKDLEVIFVDDGSLDQTKKVINEFIDSKKEHDISLITYNKNKGKGFAVKQGVLKSKNDYILFADADMSTPLYEIKKFFKYIDTGASIIIGSRKLTDTVLKQKQPWYRQKLGELYSILARSITKLDIKDLSCGFKVFRRTEITKIFNNSFVDGWIFDTEILYLAKKMGLEIKQVGVEWKDDKNTKLNIWRDFLWILIDLLKIRIFHRETKQVIFQWYHFILLFILASVFVILRRIDVVLYPQFWAEDGALWFKDVYNNGLGGSIFVPVVGYLQTISRLVAGISLLFPLSSTPLVFNVSAIIIKILPILLIFTKRFSKIIPSFWSKVLISFVYLALPNTSDTYANLTNAQWYLAISAFLLLVAPATKKIYWIITDYILIVLSVLSGPFCLALWPVVVLNYFWTNKKDRKHFYYRYLIFILASFIQIAIIVSHAFASRISVMTEYSLGIFIKMISGQVFIASLVGKEGYANFYNHFLYSNSVESKLILLFIFIIGTSIIIYSFLKGSKELKLFVIFSGFILLFSIVSPMVAVREGQSQWYIMSSPGNAMRYFLYPMLTFLLSILFLLSKKNKPILRYFGLLMIFIFVWGMQFEFFYKPWPNLKYREQIKELDYKQPGEAVKIKIIPESWGAVTIYKK